MPREALPGGRQQESNLPESVWRPLLGLKPSRTAGYGYLPQSWRRPSSAPRALGAQYMGIAHAARVAHTIEELENLDRALAT